MSVISKKQIVKFPPRGPESFYDAIQVKVNEYFKTHHTKGQANNTMRLKTLIMLSLYFIPFIFIVTGLAAFSLWLFYGLWLLMGLGLVGIGASVMHDSNHGSYSVNKSTNKLLGRTLNLVGGYDVTWRIQHNVLHHTFTNVTGLDEDIDASVLVRMSPHKPLRGFHRYQYIYAWFLYSLMTIMWVTIKDYKLLFRYDRNDLLRKEKTTLAKALVELTLYKVCYFFVTLVLPLMYSNMLTSQVLLGFLMMHLLAGFCLSCIFQPAHVVDTSDYNMPVEGNKMKNNWAVHQLLNTTDFSPDSKVISWFIGGLNFQIEHHLFPHVCHVHYPQISKIVSSVAKDHGLPYYVQPTMMRALIEHGKMLKYLGHTEMVA
ncbi:MAG: acyl-CoA desaturase [Bacteroidota bacterium]